MNKLSTRIWSVLLIIVMILGVLPASALAAETMTLAVSSKNGLPGSTVTVDITMENNPGVAGLGMYVVFDEALILEKVTYNSAMGGQTVKPQNMASPAKLTWINYSGDWTEDSVFATLVFRVAADAEAGTQAEINIEYNQNDIFNFDLDNVYCAVEKGIISIKQLVGGDINGDGETNGKDGTVLLRYLANWDVEVNTACLDCNGSGSVNNKDATRLLQYLGKWDVDLYCNGELYKYCNHADAAAVAAKAATCTEPGNTAYWYCPGCSKYFSEKSCSNEIKQEDTVIEATGHTEVLWPGEDADYDKCGWEAGVVCSVCGFVVIDRVEIPPLQPNTISYVVTRVDLTPDDNIINLTEDLYLLQLDENGEIANPNPTTYRTEDGLAEDKLKDLSVPGYTFNGWYDKSGNLVTEIPVGATKNYTLYARWTKVVYTVTFDSPDISVTGSKITGEPLINKTEYTVDQGVTFDNPPSYFGYTFVGWSNNDGFIVNRIKPGTIGNITLHANWTSNRNKAVSYDDYGAPIIIENDKEGQFLFIYNIGRIENVPLKVQKPAWNSNGVTFKETVEVTDEVDETLITGINEMISTATTESSGWTLSEEWNDLYSSTEEVGSLSEKSDKRTAEDGTVVGGKYFVSNSNGGSTYVSSESGGSSSTSSKITTDTSVGINSSYDKQTEKYCDAKLGVTNTTEVGIGAELPIDVLKLSGEIKNTTTISAEVASGRKDNEAFHVDGSYSGYVGTVDTSDSSSYYNSSVSDSSNWNSSSGYEESSEFLYKEGVESALKEQLTKTTNHSISKALGGNNSTTAEKQETEMSANEYSTSFTYDKGTKTTTEKTLEYNADGNGHYRIVTAGTVHVYAVVGYDIATASYYTYCYNVLDDATHEYLDFSKETASFDDCQNGVVTFEIPYEVNEYIAGAVGKTDGLEISDEGEVTDFEPTENFDGTVVIPQYDSKYDKDKEAYSAVKVNSFSSTAFQKAKDQIKVVVLPTYITKIPDYAFAGCTNLKTVIAYGVTEIGSYAFKDCTSLTNFYVDNAVTSLGTGAFENVPEVGITAYDSAVADAAIGCGAKNITVNLSKLKDTYENKVIEIADTVSKFKLIGNGGSYNNIQVISSADETNINSMVFANNTDTPIQVNSAKVTLARVTVEDAPGFAMVSKAENVDMKLLGTVTLNSASGNAILSKNVTLGKLDAGTTSKIVTNGKYLVCGAVENTGYLSVTPEVIDQTAFEQYTEENKLQFDANNGAVDPDEMGVYYGKPYGTLPVPIRDTYRFDGWFTAPEGGARITEDTYVLTPGDHTLYAHWTLKEFTLTFDANGGTVDEESRTVICLEPYGTLPTPERYGYTFDGWFTADGTQVTAESQSGVAEDITLTAKWTIIAYKVDWVEEAGCSISVKRTASPNAGASIGTLSQGNAIYYGDVLSVTYTPHTGHTLSYFGITSAIVDGNIGSGAIYGKGTPNAYTVSWSTGTGYSISVKRTSSPNAGAATGTLKSGATVYYGDVLSVTYSASTGYSLASKGKTSIVVSGNVTSSDIYATASANSYAYNIVYQSSNGTVLGSDSATYKYGTSNTISPKSFSGYTSPAKQTVKWDSTSAKTITFTYTPTAVANNQVPMSGVFWNYEGVDALTYSCKVEYANRTKDSVQIRFIWTNTLAPYHYYGYEQYFLSSCEGVSGSGWVNTGEICVVSAGEWNSKTSYTRSKTAYSGWLTIPVTATQTTVAVGGSIWSSEDWTPDYMGGTVTIPTY